MRNFTTSFQGLEISLPLHSLIRIETIFTVCLIRIHYLTLFVVYNSMMPWTLHCKIREDPTHTKKTKYTVKYVPCT